MDGNDTISTVILQLHRGVCDYGNKHSIEMVHTHINTHMHAHAHTQPIRHNMKTII